MNFDLKQAGSNRMLQRSELDELRWEAYDNSWIYKEKMKDFHDKHISRKIFEPNQQVWLFNSRLKLFPKKLRSRWDGPYIVNQVIPYGAIKLYDPKSENFFKINDQRLKPYIEGMSLKQTIDQVALTDPHWIEQSVSGWRW